MYILHVYYFHKSKFSRDKNILLKKFHSALIIITKFKLKYELSRKAHDDEEQNHKRVNFTLSL